jgi:hypothetical protein
LATYRCDQCTDLQVSNYSNGSQNNVRSLLFQLVGMRVRGSVENVGSVFTARGCVLFYVCLYRFVFSSVAYSDGGVYIVIQNNVI